MKTQTINIYIEEKTKDRLTIFCKNHHVSYSTCIEKLVHATAQIQKQLINDYIVKGKKTSVKVNSLWDQELTMEEKAKLYSNLVYLYFNRKLDTYYTEKRWKEIQTIFINNINEAKDNYYNYNSHIRNEARMLKNKNVRNYLKRKLAQYEDR